MHETDLETHLWWGSEGWGRRWRAWGRWRRWRRRHRHAYVSDTCKACSVTTSVAFIPPQPKPNCLKGHMMTPPCPEQEESSATFSTKQETATPSSAQKSDTIPHHTPVAPPSHNALQQDLGWEQWWVLFENNESQPFSHSQFPKGLWREKCKENPEENATTCTHSFFFPT